MTAPNIRDYLDRAGVRYSLRPHAMAIGGQELADALNVTGWRVAKSVLTQVDGRRWIAVVPAAELLEPAWLAAALGAKSARLLQEAEFAGAFPECDLGAEPPFGRLYGLPVIVDERLARQSSIVVRAGSHDECIELSWADFERLEQPRIARIAIAQTQVSSQQAELRP